MNISSVYRRELLRKERINQRDVKKIFEAIHRIVFILLPAVFRSAAALRCG